MTKRFRIALATNGRFHLLDLSRELHALGHSIRFYSWTPRSRALRYGLPAECHVNLFPKLAGYAAWEKFRPRGIPHLVKRRSIAALNKAIIDALEPCDVFIGMSGLTLEAARHASTMFGAQIWIERASEHILAQRRVLASGARASGPDETDVARELETYRLADRIIVPSRHAADSFAEDPPAFAKLYVNPFGVRLKDFSCEEAQRPEEPTILMVGAWSFRKAADVLTDAVRDLEGVRLIHVGPIGDTAFPKHPRMRHVEPVDQKRLPSFYAAADLLVLPSREDGFGLVLAQALACGKAVVCSDRTGGPDLAHTDELRQRIFICKSGDANALRDAIGKALQAVRGKGLGRLSTASLEALDWRAYGHRYADELERAVIAPRSKGADAA